jgi:Flp pilus assembly protein TadD
MASANFSATESFVMDATMFSLLRIVERLGKSILVSATALVLVSCANMRLPVDQQPGDQKSAANAVANESAQSLAQLGDAARRSGDLPSAVELYRKSLTRDPQQLSVWLALGNTLVVGGDAQEAAEAFNKALGVSPQSVDAHLGLGRVFIAQRKPNQALVEFNAALAIDPKSPQAYNDVGVGLDMLEKHGEAQTSYAKGLALAPDSVALRNNYGLSLAITGDYNKAVAELSRLSLEPGSTPRVRQNLALALGLKGDDKAAEKLLHADLDEQSIEGDLRYYAVLRQLNRNAPQADAPGASPRIPVSVETMTPAQSMASVDSENSNRASAVSTTSAAGLPAAHAPSAKPAEPESSARLEQRAK